MPRVSVIIPTYNRAHLVREAIENVLDQTFADLELIVVDDGSMDNTDGVARSFADPRLKYLKQSNKGAAAARNTGPDACTGELVAFLDSDDLFLPETLELQIAGVDDDAEAGLVYGRYYSAKGTEALAVGTPVVSTPLGAEGLALSPGEDLLLGETPEAFAEPVIELLGSPQRRCQLAEQGRRRVEVMYDWAALAEKMNQACLRALGYVD